MVHCWTIPAYLNLANHFYTIVGGDSLPARNLNPKLLKKASDLLKVGFATYLGDNEDDAETVELANVPFVLFTLWHRKTPVGELHHNATFKDLPDIIEIVII